MKLTIFKRLTLGNMTIMLMVIYMGIYVTFKLNRLNLITCSIESVDARSIRLLEHLSNTMFSHVSFEKKYLISKDQDFYFQFLEINKYFVNNLNKLEDLMDNPFKKELFADLKKLYGLYISIFKKEVVFIKKNLKYPLKKYLNEKEKLVNEINNKFRQIIKAARLSRDQKIIVSGQIGSHILKVTTIVAAMAVVLGILISFFNTRSINRSILLLQTKTKEIAKGKFEKIINVASPPEIKELADDFNMMCKRLNELDKMKVDFISHVSHELRTPLTAIKEASGMLLEGIYADKPEKHQELLTIVNQECERLINSVNRILDLSCMEAKMMDYHFLESSLIPIIQQVILMLAPIAQRKNIDLELKPSEYLPPVKIDKKRIGQVIENLIGNALKFTSDSGKVNIAAKYKDKTSSVEVTISDTGCGIHKENLEEIFGKFKRIDVGKETVRGTGLGLSIVKHIITAHGGKIWAESIPNRGSSFIFTLPAVSGNPANC
ncbi:MAG: sensor histidine kinase [Deltaproteobacteria bacterium]|nr:MAG: sensor histidine kinase [Deltaproteobacteria bacterium]